MNTEEQTQSAAQHLRECASVHPSCFVSRSRAVQPSPLRETPSDSNEDWSGHITTPKYISIFLLIHFLERQPARLLQVQRWKSGMEIIKRFKFFFLPRLVCKTAVMHPNGVTFRSPSGKDGTKCVRPSPEMTSIRSYRPACSHHPLLRQLSVLSPTFSPILCCCHSWELGT